MARNGEVMPPANTHMIATPMPIEMTGPTQLGCRSRPTELITAAIAMAPMITTDSFSLIDGSRSRGCHRISVVSGSRQVSERVPDSMDGPDHVITELAADGANM